jgi:hypothetical protein
VNPRLVVREPQKNFFSQRKKEKEKLNFGYQSTYVALVSIIAFLLIYYVWILNANATQGYTIRQLEKTQNELKVELERLDVKIAELDSLDTITSDEIFDNMVPVEDPDYLVIKEGVQYVYNN